jgi:hypothetical protein
MGGAIEYTEVFLITDLRTLKLGQEPSADARMIAASSLILFDDRLGISCK